MEEWKDIEHIKGIQISNLGNIRSFRVDINGKPMIISTLKSKFPYAKTKVDKKHIRIYLHEEVAKALIPNPDNLPLIRHIDGDTSNNNVLNLEWCSVEDYYKKSISSSNSGNEKPNDNEEEWRNIEGTEDYQVSTFGNVRSLQTGKWMLLIPQKNTKLSMPRVNVMINSKQIRIYIYKLVAKAFIPNPTNLPLILHKDGNINNNNVTNLEWVSADEYKKRQLNIAINNEKDNEIEWRNIENLEYHQVNTCGDVRYFKRGKWYYLNPNDENGTRNPFVYIYINAKPERYYIQELVAQTFIPNPNNLPLVVHKDNDIYNNNVANLEWGTIEDYNKKVLNIFINEREDLEEEWKYIRVSENYQVSNLGRMRSNKSGKWEMLNSPDNEKYIYSRINFVDKSIPYSFTIHRLVAEAFIPNPDNLPIVHHKDGNKKNNHVTNLEWSTQSNNIKKRIKSFSQLDEEEFIEYEDEEWKYFTGEDYQISNYGKVKSFKKNKNGVILKLNISGEYRAFVHKGISIPIHKLVAQYFLPFPENPQINHIVNHIDGNKLNNYYKNLQWCSPSYNSYHTFLLKPHPAYGENHHNCKITEELAIEIFVLVCNTNLSYEEIANQLNTTYGIVKGIANGHTWRRITNYDENKHKIKKRIGKLSDEDIKEIFRLTHIEGIQDKIVAKQFKISRSTVTNIKNGKAWVEVTKILREK